jgi:DNA (cytosine-5)-methyltransferase 1
VRSGRLKPWRTAAEILDLSLPCPSIFDTAAQIKAKYGLRAVRPLAEATMTRIARGTKRYVIDAEKPFIITPTHQGGGHAWGVDEPLRTITTAHRGEHAVVTPFVTKFRAGATGHPIDEPLHTITTAHSDTHPGGAAPLGVVAPHLMMMRNAGKPINEADRPMHTITAEGARPLLVAAFLAQHNNHRSGEPNDGRPADEPLSTLTTAGAHQMAVAAHMLNLKGRNRRGASAASPLLTLTADGNHAATVAAFLMKYYGQGIGQAADEPAHTLTTKDRHGLITVTLAGEPYVIVDIGMRMLTARERFLAQGFPASYIIDLQIDDGSGVRKPITGDAQGRLVGNSVCPPLAEALVRANCADLAVEARAA